MIRLCITADDYGLNDDVNAAVHALAARGAVCAASVMVHRDARLDDVAALRDRVSTGLHVVLVGERPLLPDRLAPLLDGDGRLPSTYGRLFLALARRPALLPRLADEIAAQIDRFVALRLPLDFINSHQHVHLLPPIWTQLLRVLRRRAEPAPMLRTAHAGPWGGLRQNLLRTSSRIAWLRRPPRGARTMTALGIDFAGRTTLPAVERLLASLDDRRGSESELYELVMHPGFGRDVPAARHAKWRYHWQGEYDLLLSAEFAALLRRRVTLAAPGGISAATTDNA